MFGFVVPVALLLAGLACVLWPQKIGVSFCRIGKAIWRVITFGLTDMRWFYSEERSPTAFRSMGVALILLSIPLGVIAVKSISGPGSFDAMRECRGYLHERYGTTNNWQVSTHAAPSRKEDYLVVYHYGEHTGTLFATWKRDHYTFSEK